MVRLYFFGKTTEEWDKVKNHVIADLKLSDAKVDGRSIYARDEGHCIPQDEAMIVINGCKVGISYECDAELEAVVTVTGDDVDLNDAVQLFKKRFPDYKEAVFAVDPSSELLRWAVPLGLDISGMLRSMVNTVTDYGYMVMSITLPAPASLSTFITTLTKYRETALQMWGSFEREFAQAPDSGTPPTTDLLYIEEEEAPSIVVCGQANVGKSSILNQLICLELMPTDLGECTSYITTAQIAKGDTEWKYRIRIVNPVNGEVILKAEHNTLKSAADGLQEMHRAGRQENSAAALSHEIIVEVNRDQITDPSSLLLAGVKLVDLPGLGISGDATRRAVAKAVSASCVMFVINASVLQIEEEDVRAFVPLVEAQRGSPLALLFVINKADTVISSIRQKSGEHKLNTVINERLCATQTQLEKIFGFKYPVVGRAQELGGGETKGYPLRSVNQRFERAVIDVFEGSCGSFECEYIANILTLFEQRSLPDVAKFVEQLSDILEGRNELLKHWKEQLRQNLISSRKKFSEEIYEGDPKIMKTTVFLFMIGLGILFDGGSRAFEQLNEHTVQLGDITITSHETALALGSSYLHNEYSRRAGVCITAAHKSIIDSLEATFQTFCNFPCPFRFNRLLQCSAEIRNRERRWYQRLYYKAGMFLHTSYPFRERRDRETEPETLGSVIDDLFLQRELSGSVKPKTNVTRFMLSSFIDAIDVDHIVEGFADNICEVLRRLLKTSEAVIQCSSQSARHPVPIHQVATGYRIYCAAIEKSARADFSSMKRHEEGTGAVWKKYTYEKKHWFRFDSSAVNYFTLCSQLSDTAAVHVLVESGTHVTQGLEVPAALWVPEEHFSLADVHFESDLSIGLVHFVTDEGCLPTLNAAVADAVGVHKVTGWNAYAAQCLDTARNLIKDQVVSCRGVSESEAEHVVGALVLYTKPMHGIPEFYKRFCEAFRAVKPDDRGKQLECFQKYLTLIMVAFEAVRFAGPAYTPPTLYRGLSGTTLDRILENKNAGRKFRWYSIASTSTKRSEAEKFADPTMVEIEVCEASQVLPIWKVSAVEKEKEVVIRPGTLFECVEYNITQNPTRCHIKIRTIDQPSGIFAKTRKYE